MEKHQGWFFFAGGGGYWIRKQGEFRSRLTNTHLACLNKPT